MLRAAFLGLALLAAEAARSEPRISDFQITLDGMRVVADLALVDGFGTELRERIGSGLPTAIVYEFELMRDRKRWWDRGLGSNSLQVTAMYNAVTREYLVNFKLEGKLIESRMVRDLAELERAMTRFTGVPLFSVEGMPSTRRLLVRVRADLGPRTVLSFIPSRAHTEWVESRKLRPPPPTP
jgi:uncharacterized protein DUF4390